MVWTPDCFLLTSPLGILFFGVTSFIIEALLLVLTAWKFIVAMREGWGHTPIIGLMLRDGLWAFLVIFCKLLPFSNPGMPNGDTTVPSRSRNKLRLHVPLIANFYAHSTFFLD